MSSTGPNYPTAAVDGGGSPSSWGTITNIYTDDGNSAFCSQNANPFSSVLFVTGYGFAIPSTATIVGIKAEIKRSGSFVTEQLQLIKSGTTFVGSQKTGTPPGSLAYSTYGGAADMWGSSLNVSDINSSGFGIALSATFANSSGTISVDTVRLTVYWSVGSSGPIPANVNMQKRYLYKVYTPAYNGVTNPAQYLGNLPSVTSDFHFAQDINTAGSQITVECAVSADTSGLQSSTTILDETGATILDENSNSIISEDGSPIVSLGGSNSSTIIKNGNKLQVWEYSYYHPNGICMFNGFMERWEATFGGGDGDSIKIMCYSDGSDMDNHLVRGSPFAYTLDQSQATNDTANNLYQVPLESGPGGTFYGQSFTTGAGVTNVGAITLLMNGSAANVTVNLYDSVALTTLLGTVTQSVSVSNGEVQFSFPVHANVSASTQYFFTVTIGTGQSISLFSKNTSNPYSGGQMYNNFFTVSGPGSYSAVANADLYFKTYSSNGSTTATFTSTDPTTGMLLGTIMPDYNAEGGLITASSSTVAATGLSLNVGFNTETVYEGLKKTLTVAPNGFYYYVDLGTDVLYFKQTSGSADFTITKGVHIESLRLVATIEQVKNLVYFSGGLVSGSNLYKVYQSAVSIGKYGQRLERKSDNRVTDTTTANAIGTSEIAELKDEQYQTVVTILDKTMDIASIKPGQVAGFRGFGTFADTILTQVVHIDYQPEAVTLTLGLLPKRLIPAVEQVTRGLVALNTVANPTSPS